MSSKKGDEGSSSAKKRKIKFAEDESAAVKSQPSSRREAQREVAERRAAHFARADPVPQPIASSSKVHSLYKAPVSSTPTGSLRRGLPVPQNEDEDEPSSGTPATEAWPGPFSTAFDMIAKRDAAKKAREEAIAQRAAKSGDTGDVDASLLDEYDRVLHRLEWPQSSEGPSPSISRLPLPSLSTMCATILARNFDSLKEQEIGYLQIAEREKVAIELAKLRRCDAAAALKLAVEHSQYLVLPECSEVEEESLVRAMEQAAGVTATRQLELSEDEDGIQEGQTQGASKAKRGKAAKTTETNTSAQGTGESKKKKTAAAGATSSSGSQCVLPEGPAAAEPALTVLRLRNCGRCMTDRTAAVCINLAAGGMEVLQLTGCYRLNDAALTALLASCRESLLSVDLTCNSRLGGEALACLRSLVNLQELVLDDCTQLTDQDLLRLLPDAGPSSSSGSSSSAHSPSACPPLLSLSLGGLIEITDDSIVPILRRYGPDLQELNLTGCVRLTDKSVQAVRRHCGSLRRLGMGMLGEASTAAMLGLFVVNPVASYASQVAPSVVSPVSSNSVNGAIGADEGALSDDLCVPARIGYLEDVCLQGTVCVTDDVIVQLCESNKRTLTALDVNGCHQLTSRAVIALFLRCRQTLRTLDLSFVRGCSQEAVGTLVDGCVACDSLQTLTVWGCTQLGDKFWNGYRKDSNLQVVGRMNA